jgi:hypothetical protein
VKKQIRPLLVGGVVAAGFVAALVVTNTLRSSASPAVEDRPSASMRLTHEGMEVEVTYRGEVGHAELFAADELLAGEAGHVTPVDAEGLPQGSLTQPRPTWLSFRYRIGSETRHVLVAKTPMMNDVSWDAIARAGAALGDGQPLRVGGRDIRQDATIRAADGHEYRVRLPRCGQSTTWPLSEWNLLIGGVHEGDQDFRGEGYGWIDDPYTDADLKVGYQGSLSWCADAWRRDASKRVVRGYFKVSRFHASSPEFHGTRLYWRPVLERVEPDRPAPGPMPAGLSVADRPQISPDRQVRYFGPIANDELFGEDGRIAELVGLEAGEAVIRREPQWLMFQYQGRTLLVAAVPVRRSLSWDQIAEVGAARGDGSIVKVGRARHEQRAEVTDRHGNRYRVRNLRCGESTLDKSSEWNRLIGGVHRGDGDFVASPDGLYGWIASPIPDQPLNIVAGHGGATWCWETQDMHGDRYAVNRGYLTVARFHLTESHFSGSGFGWRPVLELID